MEFTQWVAMYGAVIGTIGALGHFRNWWYDHPHISIRVSFALAGNQFTGPQSLITVSA